MKKLLLGTTAIMTAGLIASGANAAGINLSVNGYYTAAIGTVDFDQGAGPGIIFPVTTEEDDVVFQHEGELSFNGSVTLENGLTVGGEANLEVVNNNRTTLGPDDGQFDEVFAYIEGSFGRVEVGETGSAAFQMHITAPYFVSSHGVDSPNISWNFGLTSRTSSAITVTGDTMKVTYFSPVIAGAQFGITYTPESQIIGDIGGQVTKPVVVGTGTGAGLKFESFLQEVVELGATYSTEVEGVAVAASVGYARGEWDFAALNALIGPLPPLPGSVLAADDLETFSAGLSLTSGPLTVSGGYFKGDNNFLPTVAEEAYSIGVQYVTGPWTAGVAYFKSESDANASPFGVPFTTLETEYSVTEIGATYALGAGVDLFGVIEMYNNDVNLPDSETDTDAFVLGVDLSF